MTGENCLVTNWLQMRSGAAIRLGTPPTTPAQGSLVTVTGTKDAVGDCIDRLRKLLRKPHEDWPPRFTWEDIRGLPRSAVLTTAFLMMGEERADGMVPIAKFRLWGGLLNAEPRRWFNALPPAAWDE